jgi:hypothetical protein
MQAEAIEIDMKALIGLQNTKNSRGESCVLPQTVSDFKLTPSDRLSTSAVLFCSTVFPAHISFNMSRDSSSPS